MISFFRRLLAAFDGLQYEGGPLAGVRYFDGSWQEVLTYADHQNKPIFLDFYTIGHYPRRQIAQQAALDYSLASILNAHFINYRIDAKQGEGLEIAQRYRMETSPVPTTLFIEWDGSLLHRASGYEGLTGLLDQVYKALEAANQPDRLSMLEQDYRTGKRDLAFLAAYLLKRSCANMPNQEALLTYLSLVPETEWTSDETIPLILGNLTTYQPGLINTLLQKLRQVSHSPDRSYTSLYAQIGNRIRELIRTRFHQAIAGQDEQELARVIADNEQLMRAERGDQLSQQEVDNMANGYRRRFYADTKHIDKYRPLAEAEAWRLMTISMDSVREKDQLAYQRYLKQKDELDARGERPDYSNYAQAMSRFESHDMAQRLNRLVRYYADNMTDPQDLEQALSWSARSLAFYSCPGYLNLHAQLLVKLGRTREADEVLRQVSAARRPGTYRIHMSSKRPEDYER